MRVLVVGGGGREHALVWKLVRDSRASKVYSAPGNAGTAKTGENLPIEGTDIKALLEFARSNSVDFTVVGPEAPLALGIVDEFKSKGLKIFGPTMAAAQLECSKVFAKELMRKYGIPTAPYKVFDSSHKAKEYVEKAKMPVVVKSDGLAAGKGAIVCPDARSALESIESIMEERVFGESGKMIVVEEFLEGEEVTYMALSDGERIVPLAPSQDHKRLLDGDVGPNTGGMGSYSPAPILTPELSRLVEEEIVLAAVRAMAKEGKPYTGVIYAGLMMTADGPRVLEFNCRFGDPEAQAVLPRFDSDLLEALEACADCELKRLKPIKWAEDAAVCVVMSSAGYPGPYEKGKVIGGLAEAEKVEGVVVFHAGTCARGDQALTSGGRVLGVTAQGPTIAAARDRAYRAVKLISWGAEHYRTDIGLKALKR